MRYNVYDVTRELWAIKRATFDDKGEAQKYMEHRRNRLEAELAELPHDIIYVEVRETIMIPAQVVEQVITSQVVLAQHGEMDDEAITEAEERNIHA